MECRGGNVELAASGLSRWSQPENWASDLTWWFLISSGIMIVVKDVDQRMEHRGDKTDGSGKRMEWVFFQSMAITSE